MAKLIQFYLSRGQTDGNRIISEQSLLRMESVKSTRGAKAGQQSGYGLNNYTSFHKYWAYREYYGGFEGAMSEFSYLNEAKVGHAFMISSKNPLAFRKISELIRNYETKDLPEKLIGRVQHVSDQHREIEGLYYPITPRLQKLAFFFRFMSTKKSNFEGDTLIQRGLFGENPSYYYPVSTILYKSKSNGVVLLLWLLTH